MKSLRSEKIKIIVLAVLVIIICIFAFIFLKSKSDSPDSVRVFYSLDKYQNDQEIINVINNSKKYVYFAIYEFTKSNIADALIAAKSRGVDVEGITDRVNSTDPFEKPIIDKLKLAGIKVETEQHPEGIMHIKAIVTDNEYASGSYNWTSAATNENDEILEIGSDENIRIQYENILKKILQINTTSTPAKNNSQINTYDYTDALNHIGENAKVEGNIIDIYKSTGGMTFFDYCKDYKNCAFSAVIFGDNISNFSDLSSYIGKSVIVSGTIKPYQGKAEIVLSSPNQIQLSE